MLFVVLAVKNSTKNHNKSPNHRNKKVKKMKKYLYGSLFLATVGITMLACKKEVMNSPTSSATLNTQTEKEKGDLFSANEKSTGNGALDSMAQAANLAQIKWDGSNVFHIDSYDDTLDYQLEVLLFYTDSVVKYNIKDGSQDHTVLIDVRNQTIGIGGVGSFTFANFFGSNGVTPGNVLKNIVAVFTPYYALYGKVSNSWTNNGSGDTFHPNAIFWGQVEKSRGPCKNHFQRVEYWDYAFWIRVGKRYPLEPC